mmetsp:Transcript_13815/g.20361  ORF Transcript_13815/g.20361 Transcript_13815/m.20361 type:complete len:379 (-) Transcript_13815:296-1432(-)
MKTRIDYMAEVGCDYIEFDNMDWCTDSQYRSDYGSTPGQEFPEASVCAQYNIDLCDHAHEKGVLCMAKNTGYTSWPSDYAGGDVMDAGTFESYRNYFNWWDDAHLQGFLDNSKLVAIVHYNAGSNSDGNTCDYVLDKYQTRYESTNISFICESKPLKKYMHFNLEPSTSAPVDPTEAPVDPTKAPVDPTEAPVDPTEAPDNPGPLGVFPYKLKTQKGFASSDQDISVLQSNELTGTSDDWDTYIELGEETGNDTNPYKGTFFFSTPEGFDLALFNSVKLTINYYGPGDDGYYVDKRWQFQIRRYNTTLSKWQWLTLGNSGSMQDWVWSTVTFPLPSPHAENGGLAGLVHNGNPVKVRVRTVQDNNDIADIDYLELTFE